jgi:hypothetical protein
MADTAKATVEVMPEAEHDRSVFGRAEVVFFDDALMSVAQRFDLVLVVATHRRRHPTNDLIPPSRDYASIAWRRLDNLADLVLVCWHRDTSVDDVANPAPLASGRAAAPDPLAISSRGTSRLIVFLKGSGGGVIQIALAFPALSRQRDAKLPGRELSNHST